MSIHTWCYRPITLTYEEAKENFIQMLNGHIKHIERSLNDPNSRLRTDYNWDDQRHHYYLSLYKRQLQVVNKGLCKSAVYRRGHNLHSKWFNGNLYEVCFDYFDLIKVYRNYDDVTLTSLSETINFIEMMDIERDVTADFDLINEFWSKYPDGIIDFR